MVTHVRDNGDSDLGGRSESEEEWSHSGYTWTDESKYFLTLSVREKVESWFLG